MTNLARALIAAGHSVTWWSSDWNHQLKQPRATVPLIEAAARENIDLRLLPAPGYRSNISIGRLIHHEVFARRLIAGLDGEMPPDVIWSCFPTAAAALRLSRWVRTRQVKLIHDIRDLSPDVFVAAAPPLLRPIVQAIAAPMRRALGEAFAGADGLAAVSQGYLEWAEAMATPFGRLPSHRAVLPLGYKPPPFVPDRAESKRDHLMVVFAGTLGRSFDVATLVGAAELARSRRLPVRFEVAGDGERAGDVQAAASRLDNLDFRGWLRAEELAALLARADIGLMAYTPDATQGLPNKLFEYMASGLAILNALPGETATLLRDKGIGETYSAGDSGSFCDALEALIRAPADAMGARARALFLAEYDIDRISSRMTAFVEAVART